MGGFHLKAPDYDAFVIDAKQLLYLIKKQYIPYPDLKMATIKDKDKADSLTR
jgi:hypothetical protein